MSTKIRIKYGSIGIAVEVLFLFAQQSVAQWTQQVSTTGQPLESVCFVDSSLGWVVGDSGIVLHTTNGGNNWIRQISGTTRSLLSVSFCDPLNGWATGNGGTLLKTSDAGSTWTRVLHDTSFNVRPFKVQCLSPSTVVVLRDSFEIDFWTNHQLWKTLDSGATWEPILQSGLMDFHFISPVVGWVAGGWGSFRYEVYRTTSGGSFWDFTSFNWPVYRSLNRILFVDSFNGWVTDGDTLYSSSNGGVSWEVLSRPGIGSASGLCRFGPIAYATWFGVKKTTDDGLTWFDITPTSFYLYDAHFVSRDVGWTVGRSGTILRTTTGGVTWIHERPGSNANRFRLDQNYPNPFNPTTRISFAIPSTQKVHLAIFDVLGRQIENLAEQDFPAGYHSIQWSPHNLASGVYFCRMRAGEFARTRRLVLIR